MPVWHLSVSRKKGLVIFMDDRLKSRKAAMKEARKLMKDERIGVGEGEIGEDASEGNCGHLQRAMTEQERLHLPDGWMELKAIDERGPMHDWRGPVWPPIDLSFTPS